MQPLEIIIGALFIAGAVVAVVVAFAGETVVAIGVAVILALVGCYGVYRGANGEHAKFHAKHEAILRDVTKQGFKVPSANVFAVGGNYLQGTEVDIAVGKCQFNFNATKIAGRWHVTLPDKSGNGVVSLTPSDVASFLSGCNAAAKP